MPPGVGYQQFPNTNVGSVGAPNPYELSYPANPSVAAIIALEQAILGLNQRQERVPALSPDIFSSAYDRAQAEVPNVGSGLGLFSQLYNLGPLGQLPSPILLGAPGGANTSRLKSAIDAFSIPEKQSFAEIEEAYRKGTVPVAGKPMSKEEALFAGLAQGLSSYTGDEHVASVLAKLGGGLIGGMAGQMGSERTTEETNALRAQQAQLQLAQGLGQVAGLQSDDQRQILAAQIAQANALGGLADVEQRNAAAAAAANAQNVAAQNEYAMKEFMLRQPNIASLGGGVVGIQSVDPAGNRVLRTEIPGAQVILREADIRARGKAAKDAQPTKIGEIDPRGLNPQAVARLRGVEFFRNNVGVLAPQIKSSPEYRQYHDAILNKIKETNPIMSVEDLQGLDPYIAELFLQTHPMAPQVLQMLEVEGMGSLEGLR